MTTKKNKLYSRKEQESKNKKSYSAEKLKELELKAWKEFLKEIQERNEKEE